MKKGNKMKSNANVLLKICNGSVPYIFHYCQTLMVVSLEPDSKESPAVTKEYTLYQMNKRINVHY